jgi:uncharacterized protein YukE
MPKYDSLAAFMVDLTALDHAIHRVSAERDVIHGGVHSLRSTFRNVEDHWQCPSGDSFVSLATNFNGVTDELLAVLDDAIGKMRAAYNNYYATEVANTNNMR